MKNKIIFQVLCGFILQLIVGAETIPLGSLNFDFGSIESANSNLTDDVNAKKVNATCDVIFNFSSMGFKNINANFIRSLNVKNLTLRNNSITEFEKGAFDGLPNLEYLDASRNQLSLTALFSFGGHMNLKTLILDYNCLDSLCLPKDMSIFDPQERTRTISRRYFTNYDSYDDDNNDDGDRYRFLQPTTTSYTSIIGTTTQSLEQSDRRRLTINPSYYFPELENLSLRKINVDSLSADWSFNFPKLKYLDLSENSFYEPSINVYNNIPPTTLHLLMENADLRNVRSMQFKNITLLNLNHNRLYKISNRLCTKNVLCLQSLHNLQFLFASDCSISAIDIDAFKDTASLMQLDISKNRFDDLPSEIFYYVPALVYLDLSENNLNEMPAFGILTNLASLKLDHMVNVTIFDSLSSFPLMSNLSVISMRKNNLKVIPQSFLENLPALQEIDLSYNQIISLPPFRSQAVLSKLYLSYNRVSNIDDLSLNYAKSLEILDLKNNLLFGFKVASLRILPLNASIYL